jgi:adenylate cyclase
VTRLRRLFRLDVLRVALYLGLGFAVLGYLNGVFLGKGFEIPVVSRVEQAAQDALLTRWRGARKPSGRVVIVAIDERSVAAEGRWPWSRAKMAALVDRLAEGGVTATGFDVVWSDDDEVGRRLARVAALVRTARDGRPAGAVGPQLDAVWAAARGEEADPTPELDPTERLADAVERARNVTVGFMLLAGADASRCSGVGAPRDRAGEGQSPSTLGAAQAEGAARRDPAEQGWGPDGSAGGAGAQPPCSSARLRFFETEPVQVIRDGKLVPAGKGVLPMGRYAGVLAPVGPVLSVADSGGFLSVNPDRDGTIRNYQAVAAAGGRIFPSLGVALVARAEGKEGLSAPVVPVGAAGAPESLLEVRVGARVIPTDDAGRVGLDYAGPVRDFPTWSATDVLHGRVPRSEMEGRIAIVGTTAIGTWDQRVTPFDEIAPGVITHATFVENVLAGEPLQRTSAVLAGEVLLLVLLAVGLALAFARASSRISLAALVAALAGWTGLAALALQHHVRLALGLPVAQMLLTFGVAATWRFVLEESEKRHARETFGRFLAPSVVKEVLDQRGSLKLGGEKRELTVLFSDIRGFTTISEKLDPHVLLELLNEYLTPMTDIIVSGHEGTLDKYIGDAIMAFWGAPKPQADHALRACRAALAMVERLAALRERWRARGLPEIDVGVGINTGPMSVGFVGSQDRFYNYTVLGDAVNLASRLEGANRQYGTRILLGEETRVRAGAAIVTRPLDRVRVKGKREPVLIHELLCLAPAPAGLRGFLEQFEWGLSAYQAQRWEEAAGRFREADRLQGGDAPSQVYIGRCEAMRRAPPGPEWDGVFEMKTK